MSQIAFGDGKFVAVGWSLRNGNTRGRTWTSTDGLTWTAGPDSQFAGLEFNAVATVQGDFFAFAGTPTTLWRSPDGVAWQKVNLPEFGGELGTFNAFTGGSVSDAEAGSSWIYAGGDAQVTGGDVACSCVSVWRSNDPDWQQATVAQDDTFVALTVLPGAPDLVLAITNGNYIGQALHYSTDFETWASPPGVVAEGTGYLDAASDGHHIVAVGYAGEQYDEAIALVTDGATWSNVSIDSVSRSPAEQVVWATDRFVAIGRTSWWSTDGSAWSHGPSVLFPVAPADPEGGDDPFTRRAVGAGSPGVVVAQTIADGLHVWFAAQEAFTTAP